MSLLELGLGVVVLLVPIVPRPVQEHNHTAVLLNRPEEVAPTENPVTALLTAAFVHHGLAGVRVQPMEQDVTNTDIAPVVISACKFRDAATTLTAVGVIRVAVTRELFVPAQLMATVAVVTAPAQKHKIAVVQEVIVQVPHMPIPTAAATAPARWGKIAVVRELFVPARPMPILMAAATAPAQRPRLVEDGPVGECVPGAIKPELVQTHLHYVVGLVQVPPVKVA